MHRGFLQTPCGAGAAGWRRHLPVDSAVLCAVYRASASCVVCRAACLIISIPFSALPVSPTPHRYILFLNPPCPVPDPPLAPSVSLTACLSPLRICFIFHPTMSPVLHLVPFSHHNLILLWFSSGEPCALLLPHLGSCITMGTISAPACCRAYCCCSAPHPDPPPPEPLMSSQAALGVASA